MRNIGPDQLEAERAATYVQALENEVRRLQALHRDCATQLRVALVERDALRTEVERLREHAVILAATAEEVERERRRDEVEVMRHALHSISLCSQSSASSKEECGRIARAALEQQVADLKAELQREHEDHNGTIADASLYLSEAERLRAERDALRAVANEALDEVESWAAYASDYFRNKHDLVGTLDKLRSAIDAARGKS